MDWMQRTTVAEEYGDRILLNNGASMPLIGLETSTRSSETYANHQAKKEAILTSGTSFIISIHENPYQAARFFLYSVTDTLLRSCLQEQRVCGGSCARSDPFWTWEVIRLWGKLLMTWGSSSSHPHIPEQVWCVDEEEILESSCVPCPTAMNTLTQTIQRI